MSNFYKDKRVFIAGGAGLIGQSLIRQLVPLGAKVRATEYGARKIDPEWRSQLSGVIMFDLNDPQYVDGSNIYDDHDIVFWAAAKVGGAKAIKESPMELLHYNLDLASRNIKAAVDAGVERFCYVSSSYVYPDSAIPNVEGDTEIGDVPRVHYGLGWIKRFMEKLCLSHQLTSNTKFAIVRPTAIYGPYDNFDLESCHVVPALIRKIVERQNPLEIWGDGSEQRQFTYVDDLVEGMLRATAVYACGTPINIANPVVNTVEDVWTALLKIETLETFSDWSRVQPWDGLYSKMPDHVLDVQYVGDAPRAINRRVIDTNLAAFRLGYECKTSLKEGLEKTVEWYKKHQ